MLSTVTKNNKRNKTSREDTGDFVIWAESSVKITSASRRDSGGAFIFGENRECEKWWKRWRMFGMKRKLWCVDGRQRNVSGVTKRWGSLDVVFWRRLSWKIFGRDGLITIKCRDKCRDGRSGSEIRGWWEHWQVNSDKRFRGSSVAEHLKLVSTLLSSLLECRRDYIQSNGVVESPILSPGVIALWCNWWHERLLIFWSRFESE